MLAILPMATAKDYNTRSSVNIDLFGAPCELKEFQLPTYAEIMHTSSTSGISSKFLSMKKSLHCKSIKEKKKCEKFIQTAESSLFDISACKCKDLDYCVCEKSRKVRKREVKFQQDVKN